MKAKKVKKSYVVAENPKEIAAALGSRLLHRRGPYGIQSAALGPSSKGHRCLSSYGQRDRQKIRGCSVQGLGDKEWCIGRNLERSFLEGHRGGWR